MQKLRFLVTAGPTFEAIDPVRFIGNHSSGKMGIAIADTLAEKGYLVDLVLGPTHLKPVKNSVNVHNVTSAEEMYRKCAELFPLCNGAIMAAAVADFKPANVQTKKIKKETAGNELTLHLIPTTDILASLGKIKKQNQLLAGFSLETNNELENANKKLQKKNCDLMIMNSLQDKGAGFGFDTNKVTILTNDGQTKAFPLMSKTELARQIVIFMEEKFFARFMTV